MRKTSDERGKNSGKAARAEHQKTLLDIYSKYGIILILILIMAFLTIRTGGTFIGKIICSTF